MEWVLVKDKHMKELKMLETKSNSNSKFKGIKMNKKIMIEMLKINKKMTSKCKENSKDRCIQNHSLMVNQINSKENRKK
jgi:hypothetical protein